MVGVDRRRIKAAEVLVCIEICLSSIVGSGLMGLKIGGVRGDGVMDGVKTFAMLEVSLVSW